MADNDIIWTEGVKLLISRGDTPSQARGFFSSRIRDFGISSVQKAVEATINATFVVDPKAYITYLLTPQNAVSRKARALIESLADDFLRKAGFDEHGKRIKKNHRREKGRRKSKKKSRKLRGRPATSFTCPKCKNRLVKRRPAHPSHSNEFLLYCLKCKWQRVLEGTEQKAA
jgi:uncharacterized protein YlaI